MSQPIDRRLFLQHAFVGTAAALAVSLTPTTVLAAYNEAAFSAGSVADAMKTGMGGAASESADITIEAPDVAENGAVVPVTVASGIAGTESMALLIEKNATPLVGVFKLGPGLRPDIAIRVKMGETGAVIAVVKAGGKLYSAKRNVKVTAGGCA